MSLWLRLLSLDKALYRSQVRVSLNPVCVLGYSLTQSAYLCLHKLTGRIYTSRYVIFLESEFPFADPTLTTSQMNDPIQTTFNLPRFIPVPTPPLVHSPSVPPPSLDPHQQASQTLSSSSFASAEQINDMSNGQNSSATSTETQTIQPPQTSPEPTHTNLNQPQPSPDPHDTTFNPQNNPNDPVPASETK